MKDAVRITMGLVDDETYRVEVEAVAYTDDAGTTITPQLYNVTDDTVAGTGSAEAGTSPTRQTFAVTLASGDKVYRLRATNSTANDFTFVKGRVRIFATA